MKHFARFILAAIASPAATLACGQNLLVNGNFDADLSGWNMPDATPAWSSFDIDGSPTSGSVYFANTQADAGVRQYVVAQCVPITETGRYVFGGSAYTPTGQASAGNLVGSYLVDLRHTDCSGGYTAAGGFYMQSLGAWANYATTGGIYRPLSIPSLNPGASVLIEFAVEKTDAGGSFGGYFDRAYLIRDTIFTDGFD